MSIINIEKKELKKFFSTLFMLFVIALTYSISRRIKDAVISDYAGAQIISFIKIFVVLPVSILFVIMYQWLSSKIDRNKFFYFLNLPFLIYFFIYGLGEYFNLDKSLFNSISPNIDFGDYKDIKKIGIILQQVEILINNFYQVLLYLVTEMYGTLVLSFGFWSFVNYYTISKDAIRFYPLYLLGGSISTIISGLIGQLISKNITKNASYGIKFISYNLWVSCFLILLSMILYSISLKEHIKDEKEEIVKKIKKEKPNFYDALKNLFSNRIVLLMTISVLSYMSSINLVEVSWKRNIQIMFGIKQLPSIIDNQPTGFPYIERNETGFHEFNNMTQIMVGLLTIFFALICSFLIRNFGWTFVAMITPIILVSTGILFFLFSISSNIKLGLISDEIFNISKLIPGLEFLSLRFGQIQNSASKACKYSFFDTTKEMSMFSFNREERDKHKSIVDVIGGRLGKSSGSLIQQLLIILLVPSKYYVVGQEYISKYILIILSIISFIWIVSIIFLGIEIKKANNIIQEENKNNLNNKNKNNNLNNNLNNFNNNSNNNILNKNNNK